MAVMPGAPTPGFKKKAVPGGGFMVSSAMGGAVPAAGGGRPVPGGFGGYGAPPPAWGGSVSPLPSNPTAMSMPGMYQSQQTDQMGRVITNSPVQIDSFTGKQLTPGGITIEDPDQIRRARDLADEQSRLSMYRGPGPVELPKQDDVEEQLRAYFDFMKNQVQTPGREAPMATPARVQGEPEADRRAAEAAEFGRAKDRVARIAGGAVKSMRDSSASLGREGIDARNMRDIVRGGQADLASVATEQALASLKRRNDVADRNYAGDISQRGQDIGIGSTNLGAGVTQRGQDISAQQGLLSMIPSLAALSRRRVVLR